MSGSVRIATGGLIDRGQPISFRFDGREYSGFAGDTLASALLANGIRLVGRSFKYHRPRGLLTAGPEEPNGLVELRIGNRREPNTRATSIELYEGLDAFSQNRWPSLQWDLLGAAAAFAPMMVAGFYYKTFMWPASFWERVYEPLIRRVAGLGRASGVPDPDRYEKRHAFCDVLVVGAGPAGLAAALAAAQCGARVIICDQDFKLGGRLLSEDTVIEGDDGLSWVDSAVQELTSLSNVTVLPRTTVFGAYDGNVFGAVERLADHLCAPGAHQARQRFWKIRARRTIVAAGAIEQPRMFGGNDRPGIMTASAIRTYLKRFATAPGQRAAVYTTSDDGWRTVYSLVRSGVKVAAVIDGRAAVAPTIVAEAERSGARIWLGGEVIGTRGRRALQGIVVRDSSGNCTPVEVDLLGVSGGWNPQIALATHLGSKPQWSETLAASIPGELPPGMRVAGAAAGSLTLGKCLVEGTAAGTEAAHLAGYDKVTPIAPTAQDEPARVAPLSRAKHILGKAFVDFQNDVTVGDIELAVREGFRSIEHVKRYTTLGMATDQGKTSNANGNALTAELTGQSMGELGTTTFRPPYGPIAIGALAHEHRGEFFKPEWRTPSHDWAIERGAVFMDVGYWRRAQYFPKPGETSWTEAVAREVLSTRSRVGVCDVSTLGKLDIQGPDAGALLDLVYINTFSTLREGNARYGLMLREDGFVMDDGVTARLGPQQYLMTTTTANAALVRRHLDYCLQVIKPGLDVQVTTVTDQWAQYSIAGPRARDLLQALFGDSYDFSNAAFPYMAATEVTIGETPVRVFRLSFSGELAYEIAVPSCYGDSLIRAIESAGAEFGLTPYGVEALGTMRLEKGHLGGSELNGRTTAQDLGFGRMMSVNKDCIGKVLATRRGLLDADRPVLVGLRSTSRDVPFQSGALLASKQRGASTLVREGYVTSAGLSPALGGWIGLGMLNRGAARMGEVIIAYEAIRGGDAALEVCSHVFLDPKGERLRA